MAHLCHNGPVSDANPSNRHSMACYVNLYFADKPRLHAMTFGRPVMIHNPELVPLPAPLDDAELEEGRLVNGKSGRLSQLDMFVHSCRTFDILQDVLRVFYGRANTGTGGETPKTLTTRKDLENTIIEIIQFDSRLKDVAEAFPDQLQVFGRAHTPNKYSSLNLQQQVLYCR
jgi:hypothetical protein